MSEKMETQSDFDPVAFREHEDHEIKLYFTKVVIGVVVLLALAALINHCLVELYGQANGDLISMIMIPIGVVGIGMAIMILTGEV